MEALKWVMLYFKAFEPELLYCVNQTWAVVSKASGIAAASRFSGIENGTVGVASGTGKTGNTKNRNGLQVVLKSISRGGANGTTGCPIYIEPLRSFICCHPHTVGNSIEKLLCFTLTIFSDISPVVIM